MASDITPKSVAEIRSRFIAANKAKVQAAKDAEEALKNKGQLKNPTIDKNGWDGDLFNIKDLGKPWDRKDNEDDVINAIRDVSEPGVVGDLMASVVQGDWLAAQERAFRLRHMSKVRASLHAASRKYGHGHEAGLFNKGVVNYIKYLIKLSKDSVE